MVTRVRIEAMGASAAEVEAHMNAVADLLDGRFNWIASRGEQIIKRELGEPDGHTAFSGRLTLHPNVADDSGQTAVLKPTPPYVPPTAWYGWDMNSTGGTTFTVTSSGGIPISDSREKE